MVIFSDGQIGSTMETVGNFSAWSGIEGTPDVQTSIFHHGANAIHTVAGEDAYKILPGSTTLYVQFYVQFDTQPTSGSAINFLSIWNSAWSKNFLLKIVVSGGLYYWQIVAGGTTLSSTSTTFNLNTWYCLKIVWISGSGANGTAKLWVDGTEKISDATLSLSGNAETVYLGTSGGTPAGTNAYFDCIIMDSSDISIESVGIQRFCLINEMGY
jgi:hypothetical protein